MLCESNPRSADLPDRLRRQRTFIPRDNVSASVEMQYFDDGHTLNKSSALGGARKEIKKTWEFRHLNARHV